jgi:hypothetical protein
MHASVVLDHGIDLMLGINPLVPFNSGGEGRPDGDRLSRGGLPVVLSQTFRTLLQSRMQVGLQRYANTYPNIDQLVFEPNSDDGELFFTNVFSFAARRRVCELAYRNTLEDLRKRATELRPVLEAHGLSLRDDVLADDTRSILDGLPKQPRATETTARLRRALDDVEHVIAEQKAAGRKRR